MIRVAVVDDHALVREGIVRACAEGGFAEVTYEGESIEELLALPMAPDVVLLDIDLRGHSVRSAELFEVQSRGSRVIIVSATSDSHLIRNLLRHGAWGFVSKLDSSQLLVEAVGAVAAGEHWTTPELAAIILRDPERPLLSPQETLALQLYASGLKLDSVARRMGVARTTAREYIARVRAKYEAVGRPAPTKIDLYNNASQDGLLE